MSTPKKKRSQEPAKAPTQPTKAPTPPLAKSPAKTPAQPPKKALATVTPIRPERTVTVSIIGKKIEVPALPENVKAATLDAELRTRAVIVWKTINAPQVIKLNGVWEDVPEPTREKILEAVRVAVLPDAEEPTPAALSKAKPARPKREATVGHPYTKAKKGFVSCYRLLVAARDRTRSDEELHAKFREVAKIAAQAVADLDACMRAKPALVDVRKLAK